MARAVYNQRPYARRERRGWRERQHLADAVAARLGRTVLAGPFAGLRFVEVSADLPAKLLGSYERELFPTVESLAAESFHTIVNVGCADGYYAVGMAMRCPHATVLAYEIVEEQRALCRSAAEANGVGDRVQVRGECTAADLSALDCGALVIMDCEGAEDDLLVPPLSATVLVELHGWDDETLPARVLARFADTHEVEVIHSETRSPDDFPQLSFLSGADRELALFERYTPMSWALIRPGQG